MSGWRQQRSRERERFERELARGAALDAFAVVCEGSWLELSRGEYRSRLNPHAACQSVLAFAGRYRLPFLFAGSRSAAEYMTWGFLRQYLEGARKRWKAIESCREKAREMLARDKFTVRCIPSTEPGQKWFG